MDPVADKFLVWVAALALGDFCLVVREDVVDAAAVDIDLVAEDARRSGYGRSGAVRRG